MVAKLVETVVQYRTLLAAIEAGHGLAWDEIAAVSEIEAEYAPIDGTRALRRESIRAIALVRGDQINDQVELLELGPSGVVFRGAAYVALGEHVELMIDVGEISHRLCARGMSQREADNEFVIGLELFGTPVAIRRAFVRAHTADLVDRISADRISGRRISDAA